MRRSPFLKTSAVAMALAIASHAALADDADPCSRLAWDVSHELAVMKQAPQAVSAGTKAGADVPVLQLDKPYTLKLAGQNTVQYVMKPAKPTLDDGAQGGLFRFRSDKPGLYRVSITSGHWIDVIDGGQFVKSRDFSGSRGCEKPHKIVQYELAGGHELTLQLSGSTDASILLSITPVSAPAAH